MGNDVTLQFISLLPRVLAPFFEGKISMPGRGKRVNSTAKSIIVNVYEYFERSKKTKASTAPKLVKKISEATGFSVRTVYRVINEKEDLGEGKFESPAKRYHKTSRKKMC